MTPYYDSGDGRCVIYCGDCREVLPQLKPDSFDVVVTDPPYGIGWTRSANRARHSKPHDGIANDRDTTARDAALALCPVPGIVFGSFYAPAPANVKQVLVWHKPADAGLVGSVTGWRRDAEPIYLTNSWPIKKKHRSSVLHVRAGQAGTVTTTGHPHTKPLALMVWLVESCPPRCNVLDPFLGSGTTGVACIKTERRFIGIEISEEYCAMAVKRIKPVLAQSTLDFTEAPL